MNKLFKEIFEGFNKAQDIARQISKEKEPKEIKQEVTEEETEITCCGVEITQEIKDNNICPDCGEHI